MTTVPLPRFLPADALLDEFRKFDGPLIYLGCTVGASGPLHMAGAIRECQQLLRISDPSAHARLLTTVVGRFTR